MTTAAPPLTLAELERLLRAANPGVILLPPRRLRRVIKEDRDIGGLGLQVPHRRSYTISRERLLRQMSRDRRYHRGRRCRELPLPLAGISRRPRDAKHGSMRRI